jgi:hypothetical protein
VNAFDVELLGPPRSRPCPAWRPGTVPLPVADHIEALEEVLASNTSRGGASPPDIGGCSKAFLHHVTDAGLEYLLPRHGHGRARRGGDPGPGADAAAIDSDGQPRDAGRSPS